jgi:hypothetical protein
MAELSPTPIPPAEFFECWLPESFTGSDLAGPLGALETTLGVQLDGDDGGEWLLALAGGELRVAAGSRQAAPLTLVQSVADWRGALWEGRGGAIGQQAAALFRPGALAAGSLLPGLGAPPSPATLEQVAALDGLIRLVVTEDHGEDWSLGVKLGPGAIPAAASTTVTLSAEDASALAGGELQPLEAFMAGRIQVAGDVALVMQLQVIQMQAAGDS